MKKTILFGLLVAWMSALGAVAAKAPDSETTGAPLFDDLGAFHFPVTTKSAEAQRYVDQGMVLAYGFNHGEALRSFREAARLDPDCAMAYWGAALVLGPNINAPMTDEAVPQAWEALGKARALLPKASEREQAYIEALSKRYAENPPKDRAKLDLAYADAMRDLVAKYPDDLDARTLFAEALMDTMPWNYWTEDLKPRPATAEVLASLKTVIERAPDHPGANHLFIHAVESGPQPEAGLGAAYRLEDLVPGAGHLVHMPSHIYLKVGFYHDASVVNERAVAADEGYVVACRRQGFYPALYYPHNMHFLWYATAMEGRSADALAAAREVAGYVSHCRPDAAEATRQNPVPVLTLARFKKWDAVLEEPVPPASQPFEKALFHYARGLAYAAKNDLDAATEERAALEKIAGGDEIEKFDTIYLPATGVLRISEHELAGAIAARRRDTDTMIREYRAAIESQDELPYMEPPYYHYPVRQSFGLALLEAGRPAEAEAVFREDLAKTPRNGWSLFGLAESLRAQGKDATDAQTRFEEAWRYADVRLTPSLF